MIKEEIKNLIEEGKKEPSCLCNSELGRILSYFYETNRPAVSVAFNDRRFRVCWFEEMAKGIDPERASLLALWHCTGLTEMMEVENGA